MFKNMGKKIQTLAKVLCWINISLGIISALVAIVGGVILNQSNQDYALIIIIVSILGAALWTLISWIGSFMLCGYGELIENTAVTARNTQKLIEMNSAVSYTTDMSASAFMPSPKA